MNETIGFYNQLKMLVGNGPALLVALYLFTMWVELNYPYIRSCPDRLGK